MDSSGYVLHGRTLLIPAPDCCFCFLSNLSASQLWKRQFWRLLETLVIPSRSPFAQQVVYLSNLQCFSAYPRMKPSEKVSASNCFKVKSKRAHNFNSSSWNSVSIWTIGSKLLDWSQTTTSRRWFWNRCRQEACGVGWAASIESALFWTKQWSAWWWGLRDRLHFQQLSLCIFASLTVFCWCFFFKFCFMAPIGCTSMLLLEWLPEALYLWNRDPVGSISVQFP